MQRIDSEVVRLRKVRSYNDSNGFVNYFDITGAIKSIDHGRNRLALLLSKKSADYAIDLEIDAGRIPRRFRVGDMVTCTGFVRGANDDSGWHVRFRAQEINEVSLGDLGAEALDDLVRRMELPYAVDDAFKERLATPEYRRLKGARRNGNYVGLSGFVENMKYYPGKAGPNGQKGADSVKMLIRQFEEEHLSIMVELNGREALETYKGIAALSMKGFPFIRFHGEAYVKVKDVQREVPIVDPQTGEPILEGGLPKVEIHTVKTITQAIKAIASVGVGQPHHCRQPKTIKDETSGEERTEYPYPWAVVYKTRAEQLMQKRRA